MSVNLNIKDLTSDKINNIISELTFFPFDERQELLKKRGIKKNTTPKDPIQMFVTNKENNTINVPYQFGKLLTGNKKINHKSTHAKVFEDVEFAVSLRDHQIPICEEALDHLNKYKTTTLGVYPSCGKTVMGSYLSYIKGYLPMVLLTLTTLQPSWLETFKMCFPSLANRIWVVGERDSPWKTSSNISDFPSLIICMKGRVNQIPEYIREKIGTLLVDEAHLFCTEDGVSPLLAISPRYIILETATLDRADKMERMVQSMAGNHIISLKDPREFTVYIIKTYVTGTEEKNKRGDLDAGKLYQSLSNSEYRNGIILNLLESNPEEKFITLSKYVNHVNKLCELFTENGIENDSLCGNKKEYLDSFALVGTMPKIKTGFDEKMACKTYRGTPSNVLVLCDSTPTWQVLIQSIGRIMRSDNPIVVLFKDQNGMVQNHIRKSKKFINEETNGKIIEMDYTPGIKLSLKKKKKSRLDVK